MAIFRKSYRGNGKTTIWKQLTISHSHLYLSLINLDCCLHNQNWSENESQLFPNKFSTFLKWIRYKYKFQILVHFPIFSSYLQINHENATERLHLGIRSSGLWKHTILSSSRPFFESSEVFFTDVWVILGPEARFHRIPWKNYGGFGKKLISSKNHFKP